MFIIERGDAYDCIFAYKDKNYKEIRGDSMSFKRRASQQSHMDQLDASMQHARDALNAEYIRGELIRWNNQLKYLQRLVNKTNDDWYIKRAASDCVAALATPYSENQYDAGFVEGIRLMQKKVLEKAIEMSPYFRHDPILALLDLAKTGMLNTLIDYIEQLEKCVERM